MPTYRRHDPGRDGSVPLVLVGKAVVGMKFSANPHGDADDHGGYLKVNRDIFMLCGYISMPRTIPKCRREERFPRVHPQAYPVDK